MATQQFPDQPSFHITHQEASSSETLIAGFSRFGLAGLTAVDYLVDQLELEEHGRITINQLPAITPFENGTPRHHTRFFSHDSRDITILIGDLFIPPFAADAFSTALLEWTDDNNIGEVSVLSGTPMPHGPDAHQVFYVASEDYQETRLAESEIQPMGDGFLDGVNASFMQQGMESTLATGILTTPVHSQGPDFDAALRLIEATSALYDIEVDTEPLETFARGVEDYYEGLSQHLTAAEPDEATYEHMYM